MNRFASLCVLASLGILPALASGACGSRSQLPAPVETTDAGVDAPPDVVLDHGADAVPDVVDAPPDVPVVKQGLGEACDGIDGNPYGCEPGLECYQGDPQMGDDPERWPGGYCTTPCSVDAECKAWGGVCAGGYTTMGHCLLACDEPLDCRQGYACRNADIIDLKQACAPTGFIATRGPAQACFQHQDPSAPHFLPLLINQHFAAADQADPPLFYTANEIALSVSAQGKLVAGANALSGMGYVNPAFYSEGDPPLSFAESPGPQDGQAQFYSDPYLVTGKDGAFYYSTLGLDWSLGAKLLVARSDNGGATWSTVHANPASDCVQKIAGEDGPCIDHPWLAVGPDKLDPNGEAIYAAYLAGRIDDFPTVLIRSVDGGKTWGIPGAPSTSLAVFAPAEGMPFNNLITPTVDEQGVVHMVTSGVVDEPKGSLLNAVLYARSEDGGQTHTPPVRVNPVDQAVPYDQPVIATDGGNIFVVYTAGTPDGAWDVFLARSADGVTWSHEQVNDEPEPCATHFHPAMAVDRVAHRVYVAWYDGRFAPYDGFMALAVCDPALPGEQCGPNEAITAEPFFVTTDRGDFTFIGDYFTLVSAPDGALWAGFGDTRFDDVSHAFVARGQF